MQNNENNNEKELINDSDVNSQKENLDVVSANIEAKEVDLQSESNDNATQIKPRKRSIATVAATAVVGLVGIGVIASSGLINLTMDGEINEISYVDNKLVYDVNVKDVNKDNSIYFEIYDDNKSIMKYNIIENVKFDGNKKGEFSLEELDILNMDLSEPVSYKIRLKGDTGLIDRTYDSWILELSGVESEFNNVNLICDCKNSGYLLIDLDFKDDYGVFSNFSATLTDSAGTIREVEFTSNLHETQKVFVLDMAGGEATFVLNYWQNDTLKTRVNKVNI